MAGYVSLHCPCWHGVHRSRSDHDGVGTGVVVGGMADVVNGADSVKDGDTSLRDADGDWLDDTVPLPEEERDALTEALLDWDHDSELDSVRDWDSDNESDTDAVPEVDTVADLETDCDREIEADWLRLVEGDVVREIEPDSVMRADCVSSLVKVGVGSSVRDLDRVGVGVRVSVIVCVGVGVRVGVGVGVGVGVLEIVGVNVAVLVTVSVMVLDAVSGAVPVSVSGIVSVGGGWCVIEVRVMDSVTETVIDCVCVRINVGVLVGGRVGVGVRDWVSVRVTDLEIVSGNVSDFVKVRIDENVIVFPVFVAVSVPWSVSVADLEMVCKKVAERVCVIVRVGTRDADNVNVMVLVRGGVIVGVSVC